MNFKQLEFLHRVDAVRDTLDKMDSTDGEDPTAPKNKQQRREVEVQSLAAIIHSCSVKKPIETKEQHNYNDNDEVGLFLLS